MSKKAAAPKKAAGAGEQYDYNDSLRQNFKKACTAIGITANPELVKVLNSEEDALAAITDIYTSTELGPACIRALCASLLAKGMGMKPVAYQPIKSLRFWRAAATDAGVAAVAEVLKNGKEEVALTSVELIDCGFGSSGCTALGEALMLGGNTSLEALRLDLNTGIGDEGVAALCKGLRTNRTLKRLSLAYCRLGPAGAAALAEVLASPLCTLERLDVMGNALGAEGVATLARAAQASRSLKELILKDTALGGGAIATHVRAAEAAARRASATATAAAAGGAGTGGGTFVGTLLSAATAGSVRDPLEAMASAMTAALSDAAAAEVATSKEALTELGKALSHPDVPLVSVNLEMNSLTPDEAAVLVPFMTDNKKVQVLTVDTNLPAEIFAVLCRSGEPAKAKKKAGGGKKKKK